MTIIIKNTTVALLALAITTGSLNAAFNVLCRTNDDIIGGYYVNNTTVGKGAHTTIGTSSSGSQWDGVYVFKLPDLGQDSFVNASFNLNLWDTDGNNLGDADIYGLRISASQDVTTADYRATNGTLIESSFLTSNTPKNTDISTGYDDAELNNWLSSNYVAGQYAIIAVRMNTMPVTNNTRYLTYYNDNRSPMLTIVPELETYALIFGALSLGFVMLRRRFKV